ncbi:hypothetical protein PLICRDRAFT_75950, partial [Plicaturopsis crispa FD-325 SS-3]
DVLCVVNIQHDCSTGGCTTAGSQIVRQEREDTTRTRMTVLHKDELHYVVNMNALHNHQFIRSALPPALAQPPTFGIIRQALYISAAVSLRD